MNNGQTYCGSIAIVGRHNVGKSTFLNKILKSKISITSHKINTTRHYIFGIHTEGKYQSIYIDTPGLYKREKRDFLKKILNNAFNTLINSIELVIFLVNGTNWRLEDKILLDNLYNCNIPVILAVNKIDNIKNKTDLLPHLRFLAKKMDFLDIVPISAKTGINIDVITSIVQDHLPKSLHYFPKDCLTNQSKKFMASEIIREKIMRFLKEELAYSTIVNIEHFKIKKFGSYDIYGFILVRNNRQKKILIGSNGDNIKNISTQARKDMERLFKLSVNLVLWVKSII